MNAMRMHAEYPSAVELGEKAYPRPAQTPLCESWNFHLEERCDSVVASLTHQGWQKVICRFQPMIPQGIFEALIQQALSDFTPELKGLFSEYKWLNVRLYSSFVGLYGKRKRLVQMLKASIKMDADPFLRTVLQDAYHRVCNGLHESLDLEMRFRHFIINTQNPRSAVRELGIPKQASALAIFRGLSISNRDNRSVYSREFMLVYPQTHRKLIKDDSREDALKDAKKGASS